MDNTSNIPNTTTTTTTTRSSSTNNNNNNNNSTNGGGGARRWAGQLAQSAAQTMQELTTRKYTLPDKNVASQLLMYRQLLHTKCRPGLKLSRDYQGTPAQKAVKHMPWWSEGCEETGKMIISYDNLIRRLWLHGAIEPYNNNNSSSKGDSSSVETLLNEEGMPPVPHEYWVHRLGFQQTDPVTDFRSGGVLSLAMMLHVVESCPKLASRFVRPTGDASVLPFAITSINITDMMAKFLMLAKSVDRMDALLSQKPFWRMFSDPNALLACQECCMDLLADVVVELQAEREREDGGQVTVFDFTNILDRTEKRVQYDLLGAGPKTVQELYDVHDRVKAKYQQQLQQELLDDTTVPNTAAAAAAAATTTTPSPANVKDEVVRRASGLANSASSFFQSIQTPSPPRRRDTSKNEPAAEEAAATRSKTTACTTTTTTTATPSKAAESAATPDLLSGGSPAKDSKVPAPIQQQQEEGEDWAGTDIQAATDAVSNFSIGDDEEGIDDDDL